MLQSHFSPDQVNVYFCPSCMLYTVLLTIPAQRQTEQPGWRQVLVFSYSFFLTNTSYQRRCQRLGAITISQKVPWASWFRFGATTIPIRHSASSMVYNSAKREHKEAHAVIALAPFIIEQSAGQQSQTANWGWSALSSSFHRLDCRQLSLGECGTHFHHTP